MNINDFSGAKLVVMAKGHILTLLRDDKTSIPFPGMWDLPGGARDGQESPIDCVLRETFEEAALRLTPDDISWKRMYPNHRPGGLASWFFGAKPGWLTLPPVRLGNEGQAVRWMPVEEFLHHDNVVPHFPDRVQDYLDSFKVSS